MKQTTLTEKRFFYWVEDDVSVTLRSKSGSYGGGSEVLIICTATDEEDTGEGKLTEWAKNSWLTQVVGGSQEHSTQATTKGRDCDKASKGNISLLGTMVNDITPKASVRDAAFTMRQRDYKEPMVVIYELSDN